MLYPLSYGRVPAFIAELSVSAFSVLRASVRYIFAIAVCLKSWKWTDCRRDGEEDSAQTNLPAASGGTAEAETLDGVRREPFLGIGIKIEQELDPDEGPTLGVLKWNLTGATDFNLPCGLAPRRGRHPNF